MENTTLEQQTLLDVMDDGLWVSSTKMPKPRQSATAETQIASECEPKRFDSLSLLKDVRCAKVLWILADKREFESMAESLKAQLRTLMQSTSVSLKEIVPALLTNVNPQLTDAQAVEELYEQCQCLKPEYIVSHVPIPLEGVLLLPTPVQLENAQASRELALESLKNAGLLLS